MLSNPRRRFPFFAGLLALFIAVPGAALCPNPGNHLTVLRWSKDGNIAVLLGYFPDRTEFFVINGKSKQVDHFPFSVEGKTTYPGKKMVSPSNQISQEQCQANMANLNALLTKNKMEP